MNITDEVKKLDSSTATALAVFFICFIAPGFLTVFHFKRELFLDLVTVKLIILSISISAPGFFVPYLMTVITEAVLLHKDKINKGQIGTNVGWYRKHGINNAINIYIMLFISYVFSLSFIWFVWFFIIGIISTSLFEIFHLIKMSEKPDKIILAAEDSC